MKKIRINELARELEVKPGVILDLLPDLGVQEKKTHSSSIDEEVALALRDRLVTSGIPRNGSIHHDDGDSADEGSDHDSETPNPRHHEEAGLSLTEEKIKEETSAKSGQTAASPVRPPLQPPLRPPMRDAALLGRPATNPLTSPAASAPRPEPGAPTASASTQVVEMPEAAAPTAPAHAVAAAPASPMAGGETLEARPGLPAQPTPVQPAATQSALTQATPAQPAPAEPERPAVRFQPLRPPIGPGGSALHPPLTQAGSPPGTPGQVARAIPIPARPIVPATARPAGPGLPPTGPRQPLPSEASRPNPTLPERPFVRSSAPMERPAASPGERPAGPSLPSQPAPRPPQAPARPPQPPTHLVAPGPSASTSSASSVPGAPATPRPPAPRPSAPNLTPGAPIAPRPMGPRPTLAGQPPARMVVPPRPDLVQRLKQQQQPQAPRPGMAAAPAAPRPGAPARPTSPAPGQPLYRGPIRPGQPMMRGPGGPALPGQPGGLQRRPGMRPMHPTTPLRAEPSTPLPTEQQRRHQAKPGARQGQGPRKRETEGNIRERYSKRQAIQEPPPIDREITVAEGITIKELSEKLGVKANLVIKKLVDTKKVFATINQTLDVKLAEELSREFGASTNQVSYEARKHARH